MCHVTHVLNAPVCACGLILREPEEATGKTHCSLLLKSQESHVTKSWGIFISAI